MLALSVGLYLCAALGVGAMGIKYIRAQPPLDYHAGITRAENLGPETLRVLGALYKVMGGAFLSLGIVLALLALFGVWNDLFWAKLAILTGTLIAGGFSALVPRAVEQSTGVRTPWRIAIVLIIVIVVAFLLSIL